MGIITSNIQTQKFIIIQLKMLTMINKSSKCLFIQKKMSSNTYNLTNIKKLFLELNKNTHPSIYEIKFNTKSWKNNCKALKVAGIIKLALDAGKANPAPPVGPALGARGLNIMAFCKEYNAMTAKEIGSVIPVEITVYEDKSFAIKLKTPPASVLIKKAAKIEKGSANPTKTVGSITMEQVEKIAKTKLVDLNCTCVESAVRSIMGTCKNMGVEVTA